MGGGGLKEGCTGCQLGGLMQSALKQCIEKKKESTNQKQLSVNSYRIFIGEQPLRDRPSRRHQSISSSFFDPPSSPSHMEMCLLLKSN